MGDNLQGEPLQYPDVVYGQRPSLYRLLDPAIVPQLERAIYIERLDCFAEAHEIFEAFENTTQSHPVIALEHSYVLYGQSRYKDGLAVLQRLAPDVLSDSRIAQPGDVAQGLDILLRMNVALGQLFSQRAFSWARDCMDEVQEWLKDVPIEEYTDLQVIDLATSFRVQYLAMDRIPYVDILGRFQPPNCTITLQSLQGLPFPHSTLQSIPIFLRHPMPTHGMVQRFCVGTYRKLGG